jgi:hypothetical protein
MKRMLDNLEVGTNRSNSALQGETEESDVDSRSHGAPSIEEPIVNSCRTSSKSVSFIGTREEAPSRQKRSQDHVDSTKESPKSKKARVRPPSQAVFQKTKWLTMASITAVSGLVAFMVFWLTSGQEEKMYRTRVCTVFHEEPITHRLLPG